VTTPPRFLSLAYEKPRPDTVAAQARRFFERVERRRSVRDFSPEPVPTQVIANLVRAASTAPSGANRQPWTFVAVSNPAIKREIRVAAEREERENYGGRMPSEWLRALEPLGTDEHKPFLEVAPWLVVLFKQTYSVGPSGELVRNYYVAESVGIAAGMFLTAVHEAGLVALTHTPSPMGFLREILDRPQNETACLLMPVGYPAPGAKVPDLRRKPLDDVLVIIE
jgi:nitroreductase